MLEFLSGDIFNVVLSLFLFLILIGVIVFIHELGHFLAAKKSGVVVQEFAFGFGPKIWSKRWRGTEYKINLYPLGGYCKMLGDQDGSSFLRYTLKKYDEQDKSYALDLFKRNNLDPEKSDFETVEAFAFSQQSKLDAEAYKKLQNYLYYEYIPNHKGNFENATKPKKVFIVTAGVIMNFILGVTIYYVFFLITGFYVDVPKIGNPVFYGAKVSNIPYFDNLYTSDNSLSNSLIIEADNKLVTGKEEFTQILREKYDKPIKLKLQKLAQNNYEIIELELVLNGSGYKSKFDEDLLGLPIISLVTEKSLAASLGLELGDMLISVNKETISEESGLSSKFEKFQESQITIEYIKVNGETKNVTLMLPKYEKGKTILGVSYYLNNPYPTDLLRLSYKDDKLLSGFYHAVNMTTYNITGLVELFKQAFDSKDITPVVSNVTSVVGVSRVVYKLVEVRDFINILNLAALVSLSLAVMNLLPIPLFDGGHLLFMLIEQIRGRKLSDKTQERISMIAFYSLIILSVLIIFKDILAFDTVQRLISAISGIFNK